MTMDAPVHIRTATAANIPTIRAVALMVWPVAYGSILSPDQLAYMLERMYSATVLQEQLARGHCFLLAERIDAAIGFAGFEHRYRPGRTRLHKLYVLPAAQGTGAGRALLQAVLDAARGAGDHTIELNVNKNNLATAFYRKHGFTIDRDEVLDIGNGFVMDDHVMTRPVVATGTT